ncbi:MAG: cytochrome b N-terminal domain-containing protein [Thermomicrobiales bacterium]|nr:cytochrome b N-terminal domain-containing protein [Thermomicrobiales bacterium]
MVSGALDRFTNFLITNRFFKSIFRTGYPDTPRQRALIVFTNVFLHLHPTRVRRSGIKVTYTFCLGGLSFFLFLALTLTGVLLMFYYIPSVERAYADMKDLATTVAFGTMLRNMHRWAAHAMVIMVFLHMMRVFYTGSYKPPREFNWVVGVILLVLTLLLSFTGYLLPWDQLAYWAVTVGTNMAGAVPPPEIGSQVRFLLIGGFEVGQNSLLRFYVLHVIGLPLLAAIFMTVHFWRIRKDGGISGPPL